MAAVILGFLRQIPPSRFLLEKPDAVFQQTARLLRGACPEPVQRIRLLRCTRNDRRRARNDTPKTGVSI